MLDQLKRASTLARTYVWALLLTLYPFADQILAGAEAHLPALAPYLGTQAFRYMGLAIVLAKLALQLVRGWQQMNTHLARSEPPKDA